MTPLTSTQKEALARLSGRWFRSVACCTAPAETQNAEDALKEAYEAAGLEPPRQVLWAASPRQAGPLIWKASLGEPAWFPAQDQVRKNVVRKIIKHIGHRVFAEIEEEFAFPLLRNIRRSIADEFRRDDLLLNDLFRSHGCHSADSLGPVEFCQRALGIKSAGLMRGIIRVAKTAGWWWPFTKGCVITDRPNRLEFGDHGLHCADGPALSYRDGWEIYAWRGVPVPRKVILHPERLTIPEITRMINVRARYCAIERYGIERFVRNSKAEKVHADDHGVLYRKRFLRERAAFLKVVNATPEKDGSFKNYFLRVPPEMQTARQAVAWTFGIESERGYSPVSET